MTTRTGFSRIAAASFRDIPVCRGDFLGGGGIPRDRKKRKINVRDSCEEYFVIENRRV